MKKKKVMSVGMILFMFSCFLICAGLITITVGQKRGLEASVEQPEEISLISENKQLMTTVETKEEAEKIAGIYGITLTEYYNGVAVFSTDEDPYEIIERGQEQGCPQLFINYYHFPLEEER